MERLLHDQGASVAHISQASSIGREGGEALVLIDFVEVAVIASKATLRVGRATAAVVTTFSWGTVDTGVYDTRLWFLVRHSHRAEKVRLRRSLGEIEGDVLH